MFLFLISIFSILLYFKNKNDNQAILEDGICPSCNAQSRSFTDNKTNTLFSVDVIKKRVLKSHGCSGIIEYEYTCNSCGLKEIHNNVEQSCGI
jgi:rubrerythrin